MTGSADGAAFNAGIDADSSDVEARSLDHVRSTVAYLEREYAGAVGAVENACRKAAKLRLQADEAIANAEAAEQDLADQLADARRQLTDLEA